MTDNDYQREIAKIESTYLGFEDHGAFTAFVTVSYGGASQGVGGYFLGTQNGAACARFLQGVLKACGVDTWRS